MDFQVRQSVRVRERRGIAAAFACSARLRQYPRLDGRIATNLRHGRVTDFRPSIACRRRNRPPLQPVSNVELEFDDGRRRSIFPLVDELLDQHAVGADVSRRFESG
jgi:hypothetical protein